MNMKLVQEVTASQIRNDLPEIAIGDTVIVGVNIIEGNKKRVQDYQGLVIKMRGSGVSKSFTVRKNSNGVGVEKTWPLHSPTIEKIEVVRLGKARRAKLNYLRERVGKAAKVKEIVR